MVEAQVVGLMKMPVGFVNMCKQDGTALPIDEPPPELAQH